MANAIFLGIKEVCKEQARQSASIIVEAFQSDSNDKIDLNCIKFLAESFYTRFSNQINRMTMCINTNGKVILHETDGVVMFANTIVQRIAVHLMQNEDDLVDESSIKIVSAITKWSHSIKNHCFQFFGDPQNIRPNQRVPLLSRCLMASWKQQMTGLETKILLDKKTDSNESSWSAGDILCHTGICVVDNNQTNFYQRPDYFMPNIGYCFSFPEEVSLRGYEAVTEGLTVEASETSRCSLM